jgi:hypothetical protein
VGVDKVKLYEFDAADHDMIVLTGVVSQLYNRIKDTGFDKEYSLRALLSKLSERGLDIDREEFIDMIKNPPLKNLISDIRGNKVIFKGQSDSTDSEIEAPDASTDTLEKMAKRASKKLD